MSSEIGVPCSRWAAIAASSCRSDTLRIAPAFRSPGTAQRRGTLPLQLVQLIDTHVLHDPTRVDRYPTDLLRAELGTGRRTEGPACEQGERHRQGTKREAADVSDMASMSLRLKVARCLVAA